MLSTIYQLNSDFLILPPRQSPTWKRTGN